MADLNKIAPQKKNRWDFEHEAEFTEDRVILTVMTQEDCSIDDILSQRELVPELVYECYRSLFLLHTSAGSTSWSESSLSKAEFVLKEG